MLDSSKKVVNATHTMVTDLQSARERVEKAYVAQEKAWADCEEADKQSVRVMGVDSDPWLAGLRYQTAVKALETVQVFYSFLFVLSAGIPFLYLRE